MSASTPTRDTSAELDQLCINTIRALSLDAVQRAESGHPGLPLGCAPLAYVLWTRFLRTTRATRSGAGATASYSPRATARCCSTRSSI